MTQTYYWSLQLFSGVLNCAANNCSPNPQEHQKTSKPATEKEKQICSTAYVLQRAAVSKACWWLTQTFCWARQLGLQTPSLQKVGFFVVHHSAIFDVHQIAPLGFWKLREGYYSGNDSGFYWTVWSIYMSSERCISPYSTSVANKPSVQTLVWYSSYLNVCPTPTG